MIKFKATAARLLNRKLTQLSNMVREHDCESLGMIDDVYETRFCVNKHGMLQAVLYDEDDQPIAAVQYSKDADNCMSFVFGYVKHSHRGNRFGEKLSNAILVWRPADAIEGEPVYVCMGGYANDQSLYMAKKFFNTGKFRVWICEKFADVCDETEIVNVDDFENVFGDYKIKSYVTLK
jgi:hypothetical protein